MESNPMLMDVWRIKDHWVLAADEDIHSLRRNAHRRAAEHSLCVAEGRNQKEF